MSDCKILLFIPSPREIPVFVNTIREIKGYDKLFVRYYPELEAYEKASEWFLQETSGKYTHFAICPDDLLFKQEDIDLLKQDIEENQYDVIQGYCKNTIRQRYDWTGRAETVDNADSNLSWVLPPNPPVNGTYDQFQFLSMKFLDKYKEDFGPMIKVKFAGFPLTILSRKVIETIPFRRIHCCIDSFLAFDLAEKGIDQYADLRVRIVHIEASDPAKILVGKRTPTVEFERDG